jgi:acyl-CoA synthetase (AMP-forming)/AMP-acid ligase II
MMLIGDMLRRDAKLFERKVGLIDGGESFTYSELNSRANRLVHVLSELGIKKGDRVAFMGNNCHQFVEFYFALAKGGFVSVPVNARFSSDEASYIVNHSESIALIYSEELRPMASQMLKNTVGVKWVISTGQESKGVLSYEKILQEASDQEPQQEVRLDDVAMIMYTSGATGLPKGVVTTQRNIMENTNTMCIELRIVPEDITVLVMPLYHNGGLWPTMSIVYRGGMNVLLPHFDLETMLKTIEEKKVTLLNLVPTMLLRMVSHPNLSAYNLESLRLIMYAGAPIPLEQLKKAMTILGPHRFYNSLGCTEASGNLISFPTTEHALEGPMARKLGSVGKDAIGVEIAIVDEKGNEVPTGKTGEIIGRGDNITQGYWKMPEETAEVFKNGWLHTGDMGYRDEDGYIFVVDRKKDIIISGGENVASREVEEVLYQHPAVQEATVIGVPDEEWGEAVKAVIVLKPESAETVEEDDLIEFCKTRLAGYKKPRSIDLVGELPKNAAGKIDKARLKNLYKEKYEKEHWTQRVKDGR